MKVNEQVSQASGRFFIFRFLVLNYMIMYGVKIMIFAVFDIFSKFHHELEIVGGFWNKILRRLQKLLKRFFYSFTTCYKKILPKVKKMCELQQSFFHCFLKLKFFGQNKGTFSLVIYRVKTQKRQYLRSY